MHEIKDQGLNFGCIDPTASWDYLTEQEAERSWILMSNSYKTQMTLSSGAVTFRFIHTVQCLQQLQREAPHLKVFIKTCHL